MVSSIEYGTPDVVWSDEDTLAGSSKLPTVELNTPTISSLSFTNARLALASEENDSFSVVYYSKPTVSEDTADGNSVNVYISMEVVNSPQYDTFVTVTRYGYSAGSPYTFIYAAVMAGGTGGSIVSSASYTDTGTLVCGWHSTRVTVEQFSGNHRILLNFDEALVNYNTVASTTTGQPSRVSLFSAGGTSDELAIAFGHFAIASGIDGNGVLDNATDIALASGGYVGETPVERAERICEENDLTLEVLEGNNTYDSITMGPQEKTDVVSILANCSVTDGGILYELPHDTGYGFKTRTYLYEQPVTLSLSWTDSELYEIPGVISDDQGLVNDITVSDSATNTEIRFKKTIGWHATVSTAGRYEKSLTVNSETSTELEDVCRWVAFKATWNGVHVSDIVIEMHRSEIVGDETLYRQVGSLEIGDKIEVTNAPSWLSTDDLRFLVRSLSGHLSNFTHERTLPVLENALPWEIAVLDGAPNRVDIEEAQLLTAINSTDTPISVQSVGTHGDHFTFDPGELDFYGDSGIDFRINAPEKTMSGSNGERVTAGSAYEITDTFTRTASELAGTDADTGQTWTTVTGTSTDMSVSGTEAEFVHGSAGTTCWASVDADSPDVSARVQLSFSFTVAIVSSISGGIVVRHTDSNNYYLAEIVINGGTAIASLRITAVVSGSSTTVGTYTLGTNVADSPWTLKVAIYNRGIRAKAWSGNDLTDEPRWLIDAPDDADGIITGDLVGLYSNRASGNTNTNPTISFDDFNVHQAAIQPTYYDSFDRTVTGGVGTSDDGGSYTLFYGGAGASSADYNVSPYSLTMTVLTAGGIRGVYRDDLSITDVVASLITRCPIATGDNLEPAAILLRGTTVNDYIMLRIEVTPSQETYLVVNTVVSAVDTTLASQNVGITHSATTKIALKAAVIGDYAMAKAWNAEDPEPSNWSCHVECPITAAGWIGLRSGRNASNTNTNPAPEIMDFWTQSPQDIAVTRSVNGVSRSWVAGSLFGLWRPMYLGR